MQEIKKEAELLKSKLKLSRNKLCETNKDIEIFKNESTEKRNKRIKHDTVRLELRKEMLNRADPLRKSLMFIKPSKKSDVSDSISKFEKLKDEVRKYRDEGNEYFKKANEKENKAKEYMNEAEEYFNKAKKCIDKAKEHRNKAEVFKDKVDKATNTIDIIDENVMVTKATNTNDVLIK